MAIRNIDARKNPNFVNIVGGYHDPNDIVNYFLKETPFDDESKLNEYGDLSAVWNTLLDDTLSNSEATINLYIASHRIANRVAEQLAAGAASYSTVNIPGSSNITDEKYTNTVRPLYKYSDLENNQMSTWNDFGTAFNGAKWNEIAVYIDNN